MSVYDLVPTPSLAWKFAPGALTLPTTWLSTGSLLSLKCSLGLSVLFPSRFFPSAACPHRHLHGRWVPLERALAEGAPPAPTTSTDMLAAHRIKASPIRDCSWHSSEGNETYFWHLFIPLELFSIHVFSVELAPLCHWISSAWTTFACNQALKAQLSWT